MKKYPSNNVKNITSKIGRTCIAGILTLSTISNAETMPRGPKDHLLKSTLFVSGLGDDSDLSNQVMEPTGPESKTKIYIKNTSHLAIDSKGNIFVNGPKWITQEGFAANGFSKISPAGAVTPIPISISQGIDGIAVDRSDNLYFFEYAGGSNNYGRGGSEFSMFPAWRRLWSSKSFSRIHKLTPGGSLSTFIGKTRHELFYHFSVDSTGNLFIGSYLGLKKFDSSWFGKTSVILAYDKNPFTRVDPEKPTTVHFDDPSISGTVLDKSDNLYFIEHYTPTRIEVSDELTTSIGGSGGQTHDVIKRLSRDGKITVIAGVNKSIGPVDGPAATAGFEELKGLCIDDKGNLYSAEKEARIIRKIDPQGNVTTIASTNGNDVLDIAVHGTSLYVLRKTGLDVLHITP